jgi:hypothetical protein
MSICIATKLDLIDGSLPTPYNQNQTLINELVSGVGKYKFHDNEYFANML